jgi:hypothetical protein
MPGGTDPCYGDELVTFSPEQPRVGNELLIAVTSSHPHPYGRLAGTEIARFMRERPGQKGLVWEWIVTPTYPGQHQYTFYVDSTIPCQKVDIRVLNSLATRTPTPTKTPTPWGWDNGNNNNNGNGNSNNNDNNNGNTTVVFAPRVNPQAFVIPGQDVYGCSNFESQANAQSVLRYDPSDPNRLDAEDGFEDGLACTTYSYNAYPNDRDFSPVQRSSGTFDPRHYLGQGDRYGCNSFASQAQAQAVLRADPSDPNQLDTDPRNGVACESREASRDGIGGGSMPGPFDQTPVPR